MPCYRIKQFTILLLAMFFFVQCKTLKENRRETNEFRSIYEDQFKLTYTRKLLQAGFNHSDAINSILETDPKGFTDPILSNVDYDLINSLVYRDNLTMMIDSTNRIGMVAEGAEGKHVISFLIKKYDRKWIDSLAKVRYKTLGVKKFE